MPRLVKGIISSDTDTLSDKNNGGGVIKEEIADGVNALPSAINNPPGPDDPNNGNNGDGKNPAKPVIYRHTFPTGEAVITLPNGLKEYDLLKTWFELVIATNKAKNKQFDK